MPGALRGDPVLHALYLLAVGGVVVVLEREEQVTTQQTTYSANNTLGFYGQEDIALNERLFIGAALRIDNNNAFGSKAS